MENLFDRINQGLFFSSLLEFGFWPYMTLKPACEMLIDLHSYTLFWLYL